MAESRFDPCSLCPAIVAVQDSTARKSLMSAGRMRAGQLQPETTCRHKPRPESRACEAQGSGSPPWSGPQAKLHQGSLLSTLCDCVALAWASSEAGSGGRYRGWPLGREGAGQWNLQAHQRLSHMQPCCSVTAVAPIGTVLTGWSGAVIHRVHTPRPGWRAQLRGPLHDAAGSDRWRLCSNSSSTALARPPPTPCRGA